MLSLFCSSLRSRFTSRLLAVAVICSLLMFSAREAKADGINGAEAAGTAASILHWPVVYGASMFGATCAEGCELVFGWDFYYEDPNGKNDIIDNHNNMVDHLHEEWEHLKDVLSGN